MLSGNLPDGTRVASMNNPGAAFTATPVTIPAGKLPTGASRLPAPPIFIRNMEESENPSRVRNAPSRLPTPARWFFVACAAELSLAVIAAFLGNLFQPSPWAQFKWGLGHALIGLGAGIPLFVLFVAMLRSGRKVFPDIRRALDEMVGPIFANWSIFRLAAISICAGIGEELLFRGFVQAKLAQSLGPFLSLATTSFLFGCVHPITLNYVAVTAGVGVYLGGLQMATGNLLVPMVTHAAYDFMALVYYLRVHRKS